MFSRIFFLFLTGIHTASAQTMPEDWMLEAVPPPQEAHLFRIGSAQQNHQFRIALPEGNTLIIDFLRLSDWGEKNRLEQVAAVAAQQFAQLRDSFRSATAVQTLEINIPIDGQTIAVRYREDPPPGTQLVRRDGGYYPLKTGMDTLRIVENTGVRTRPSYDSGIVQVQYTFVLKYLEDIGQYARDPELLTRIGGMIDSVVHAQRGRWKQQDLRYHELHINYDPERKKQPLLTSNKSNGESAPLPFLGKTVGLYLGVGATLFRNTMAPSAEFTYAYVFPEEGKRKPFVGFTTTSFYLYYPNGAINRAYVSVNAETGICSMNGFIRRKTSVGIGYMYSRPASDRMVRLFVNYGTSELITVGWDMNFNTRKKDDTPFGIHVLFNL